MIVKKIVVVTCLLSLALLSCRPTEEPGPGPEPSSTTKAAGVATTGLATPVVPSPTPVPPSPTSTPTRTPFPTPSPLPTSVVTWTMPLTRAIQMIPPGEPPVLVVDVEDGATLHLRLLNGPGPEPTGQIRSPRAVSWVSGLMDDQGNLYLLARDRIGGYNPKLYIVAPDGTLKEILIRKSEDLHRMYFLQGKVLVTTRDFLDIIEDSSIRTIRFSGIGNSMLVEGQKGEVIILGGRVDEKGEPYLSPDQGKPFAQVATLNLDSGQVTERLLPAPQTEEDGRDPSGQWLTVPGGKYGYTDFVGISPDLRRLYYTYGFVKEAGDNAFYTALGVFDTEKGQDLPIVCDECCLFGESQQYKDYLMVSHFPEAGGSALLLNMKDLSPVVDLYELVKEGETRGLILVLPFGKYFLIGADSAAFLLSQKGDLLKEYPLPSDLVGKMYTLVAYWGDD